MLSVTGEKPRNRKVTVTSLVAPLVLLSALEDVDDPINDLALSGKEAGATVYAVTEGTLTSPVSIELRIATGNQPEDPWLANKVDAGSVSVNSNNISDAGSTGKTLIKAESSANVKDVLGYLTNTDVATATNRGPILMAARQTGYTVAANTDTASTATTVAGLLTDLNDLISKYNTLRTDLTNVNASLTSTIVALKAAGAMAQ